MSLTIILQPNPVELSGNEVIISLSSDTVTTKFHKLHVRIINANLDVIGEEVLPALTPVVNFDIHDYLKIQKRANFNVADIYTPGIQVTELVDQFKFEVFETYDNDGIEHDLQTIDFINVMQGGIMTPLFNFYKLNAMSFYSQFISSKQFLTWQPFKYLTATQADYLYFYSLIDQQAKIQFTLLYEDNSTELRDTGLVSILANKVYAANSSIFINDLLSNETETNKVAHIEISITNELDEPITNTRIYLIDRMHREFTKQFVFKNSLGTYDFIMLKGLAISENEIDRQTGSLDEATSVISSLYKNAETVASGYLATSFVDPKEAQKYLIELVNSSDIYRILGKFIYPIISKSKKISRGENRNYLYNFVFEYENAQIEGYYSQIDDSDEITFATFSCSNYFANDYILDASTHVVAGVDIVRTDLDPDALNFAFVDFLFDFNSIQISDKKKINANIGDPGQTVESAVELPTGIGVGTYNVTIAGKCSSQELSFNVVKAIILISNKGNNETISITTLHATTNEYFIDFGDGDGFENLISGINQKTYTTDGPHQIIIFNSNNNYENLYNFVFDNEKITFADLHLLFENPPSPAVIDFDSNLITIDSLIMPEHGIIRGLIANDNQNLNGVIDLSSVIINNYCWLYNCPLTNIIFAEDSYIDNNNGLRINNCNLSDTISLENITFINKAVCNFNDNTLLYNVLIKHIQHSILFINGKNCALTEQCVDEILNILVNYNSNNINGICDISGGNNSLPSATGYSYLQELENRGWTITTN